MRRTKRMLGLLAFLVLAGGPAVAQEAPAPAEKPATQEKAPRKPKPSRNERPAYDISASYVFRSYYPPTSARFSMQGFDVSVDYNIFRRWLSAAAEVTGTYGSQTVQSVPTNTSLYTFMVGPRVYPFGHLHRVTPYGQILFGGGYVDEHFAFFGGVPGHDMTDAAKAFSGGGGFKMRVREKWDINLIQLDYESTYFFPGVGTRGGQRNFRAAVGLSYRWGKKR